MSLLLGITACAEMKLQTIPAPPPTAKLRVFCLPVTDTLYGRAYWPTPHEIYAGNVEKMLARFLLGTGIYEVVPAGDVDTVLGGRKIKDILWQQGNWEEAGRVGRSLHADYVVIARRGFQGFAFFQMVWINLETGKVFESKDHPVTVLMGGGGYEEEYRRIARQMYGDFFQQAKVELLATAIRKGRILEQPGPLVEKPAKPPSEPAVTPAPKTQEKRPPPPPPVGEERMPVVEKKETPGPVIAKKPVEEPMPPPAPGAVVMVPPRTSPGAGQSPAKPAAPAVVAVKPPAARPAAPEQLPLVDASPASGKTRLVVYDLETTQPMHVAGLIITEALREEIFKLGAFDLVNREDLIRAMEELKLQQSGLVFDKDAVRMGHWLAARQSVTGRLGSLGMITFLQAKRTDIETMGTLAIGSLKAPCGKEEELIDSLPILARQLIQKQ